MQNAKVHLTASYLTIPSALITIANFILSITSGWAFKPVFELPFPAITSPLKLVAFVLLEAALAYAFGRLIIWLTGLGQGLPIIFLFTFCFLSAWTSLFNVQWIVVSDSPTVIFDKNQGAHIWFITRIFVFSVLACLVAVYFIVLHGEDWIVKPYSGLQERTRNAYTVQVAMYLLIFFIFAFTYSDAIHDLTPTDTTPPRPPTGLGFKPQ